MWEVARKQGPSTTTASRTVTYCLTLISVFNRQCGHILPEALVVRVMPAVCCTTQAKPLVGNISRSANLGTAYAAACSADAMSQQHTP